ncbi:MAG: exodeoxyribonuclease VII large subunit [Rickettsiales bacterium]|jgi:exodeoxyribonuclease VII large subunit|nr:exodeoxyribonuclease VII large subunit [Rickettsiales bacterium]
MTENENIFSVSELSNLLKRSVETNFSRVKLRGELSGITRAASGHIYLSIKDADAVINGILWRGTPVNFDMADGIEVIATGKLTTYPARSNYQIIISEIDIAGAGSILKMIEERKRKLAAEGLFDAARKKALPQFPRVIGIVTSPTGAAIQDIMNKLRERMPARVLLYPAQVQGASAAAEVAAGIKYFNAMSGADRPDVMIVARGGGAIEDLLPFSEEVVVRAAAASEIPLISGVGHEPDWTLIDFAADFRAPTPTGAAEIVLPLRTKIAADLDNFARGLRASFLSRVQNAQMRLDGIILRSPLQQINDHRLRLTDQFHLLNTHIRNQIKNLLSRVSHTGDMLESMSYKNVLRRGYAIVRSGGRVVSSKDAFALPASIEFADGVVAI